jgi:hypothetical protein
MLEGSAMTQYGKTIRGRLRRATLFLMLLTAALAAHAQEPKITADELIARHLESIGPVEARQRLKTRAYDGEGIWRVLVGGVGEMSGEVFFVSSRETCDISFDTGSNPAFYGERFSFDGEKAFVKRAFQREYSLLGRFMQSNVHILGEGLLGGTAGLSWPLQDLAARQAKLRYRGLKDVEGRRLHRLDYQPKKRKGELKIELYFEPETYRHVRTEYRDSVPAGVGADLDPFRSSVPNSPRDPTIARMQHSLVRLTEMFDNFQPAEGVTLPVKWTLRLDIFKEGRNGSLPNVSEMQFSFQQVHHNEPIDRESFQSQ